MHGPLNVKITITCVPIHPYEYVPLRLLMQFGVGVSEVW